MSTPRRIWPVLIASVLAGTVLAACGGSSKPNSTPTTTTSGGGGGGGGTYASGFGGPVPPPSHGLYLGVFDNAAGTNGTANGGMGPYNQLLSFESQIGRKVAIDLHYTTWSTPLNSPSVVDDLKAGRIPLISWQCGPTDASVSSGADDALIIKQAKAVAALGKPVMIRWFWEMGFTGSNGGGQGARAAACIGTGGPAGFVAAWQHIVTLFRANGATNVAWVFCPGQAAYSANNVGTQHAASAYYPGNAYVDWIAEDAYSRKSPVPLSSLISRMYAEYGNSGKPLMLCETGAEGDYQSAFLQGATSIPSQYPNFKAMVYFDSHGPLGTYVLSSSAIAAFKALGDNADYAANALNP